MSLSRPGSARQGIMLTTMSQNKQAPRWTIPGRSSGRDSRDSTPGPGAYGAGSRKRTPSYGFGTATRDQLRPSTAPGPGAYGSPQLSRPASAGPAFGHSRRANGSGHSTPGPGAYTPNVNSTRQVHPKYTATPRRSGADYSSASFGTPGPGTYGAQGKSPVGKRAPTYGFGTSLRGHNSSGPSPGPGAYNLRSEGTGPKFSIRCRQEHGPASSATPGPGSFGGMYTQFGY
mmetsp:Transcript_48831/g.87937  ORF Transcript_48831/g.87937 Transcript_48831/m.87937 type:complete len:230 (+) Transcript_48831:101-790(+)